MISPESTVATDVQRGYRSHVFASVDPFGERPRNTLAVVVKRTYALSSDGRRLVLADAQEPLCHEPEIEMCADGHYRRLIDDTDLCPYKPATDVVAFGSVHAPGEDTRELPFALAVGGSVRRLMALGPRRVHIDSHTGLRFTEPEPFSSVPLDYAMAYGGHDAVAQRLLDDERVLAVHDAVQATPPEGLYAYPRNTIGLGYIFAVEPMRADGMVLPQLEDPMDRLRPERLFVPALHDWASMPLPASLGWLPHTFYPRVRRMLGVIAEPPYQHARELDFEDAEGLEHDFDPRKQERPHPRVLQGAAPGLAAERLRGDELVIAEHLHPKHTRLEFSLPAECARVSLRVPGVGQALDVDMVLSTLRLRLDADHVSLAWTGSYPMAGPAPADFAANCRAQVRFRRLMT